MWQRICYKRPENRQRPLFSRNKGRASLTKQQRYAGKRGTSILSPVVAVPWLMVREAILGSSGSDKTPSGGHDYGNERQSHKGRQKGIYVQSNTDVVSRTVSLRAK